MRYQSEVIQMLHILRDADGSRALLCDLLGEYGGKMPHHTGAGVFGGCIASLVDTGYIHVSDGTGRDVTDEIKRIGRPSDWSLMRGYSVARFLTGRENEFTVLLTEKLGELQTIFGLSLTRLLDHQRDDAMVVTPVFGKPTGRLKADVFVLMPFAEEFSPVFDDHIMKVCKAEGLIAKRADDIFGSGRIIDDIWELTANSKVIVADCTGKNPNVFYELGIAHALGKTVIIITQSSDDIPFDITHIRYIKYEYTPRGMKSFEASLSGYLREASSRMANKSVDTYGSPGVDAE